MIEPVRRSFIGANLRVDLKRFGKPECRRGVGNGIYPSERRCPITKRRIEKGFKRGKLSPGQDQVACKEFRHSGISVPLFRESVIHVRSDHAGLARRYEINEHGLREG